MKRIERIEVETFSHATESLEKVLGTLLNLGVPNELIETEDTYGHYGNTITVVKANIKRQNQIKAFIDSPFFKSTREDILLSLLERIDDKGVLHIRADKQDLFYNSFKLYDRGDVRILIKILSYPLRKEKVIENAKEIFGN